MRESRPRASRVKATLRPELCTMPASVIDSALPLLSSIRSMPLVERQVDAAPVDGRQPDAAGIVDALDAVEELVHVQNAGRGRRADR